MRIQRHPLHTFGDGIACRVTWIDFPNPRRRDSRHSSIISPSPSLLSMTNSGSSLTSSLLVNDDPFTSIPSEDDFLSEPRSNEGEGNVHGDVSMFFADTGLLGRGRSSVKGGEEDIGMEHKHRDSSFSSQHSFDSSEHYLLSSGRSSDNYLLFYIHGGGTAFFTGDSHLEWVCRLLFHLLEDLPKMKAVIVHYRRAPEFRHPASVDDLLAAYRWILKSGGVSRPKNIIVAGESAGGLLGAQLLYRLRKETPDLLPLCAVFYSPMLDLAKRAGDYPKGRSDMLGGPLIETGVQIYLGHDGNLKTSPEICPLYQVTVMGGQVLGLRSPCLFG